MNARALILSLCVPLGLCAVAPAAFADDFTITVPVDVDGAPLDINRLVTSCQVFTDVNSVVVGAASTNTPMSGGAFRGDVVVRVNASGGVDPAQGTRYRCSMWFVAVGAYTGGADIYYYSDNTEDGRRFRRFPVVAGEPMTLTTGMLPLPR